jgi:hypothetical protein
VTNHSVANHNQILLRRHRDVVGYAVFSTTKRNGSRSKIPVTFGIF